MLVCGTNRSLPSVPRSKGCLTCVSRKTRCDGRRPTCHACENRKQACGGYRRDEFVFLNEGWRTLGVASESRRNQSSLLTSEPPTLETDADSVFYSSLALDRSHLHIAYFLASFGTRPGEPSQALGSLGHLFRHYLPLVSSNTHDGSFSPITPVVFAVDALACSYFGAANVDPVSVRQSFHSYGMALRSMSARLTQMKRVDSSFYAISEEEWQHFAFFCLVMAFCEMKMSPASRNWEKHVRCLAAVIILRDKNHAYSKINFQVLASSRTLLMLQTLSAKEPNDWQQRLSIRSAWLRELRSALQETDNTQSNTSFELYRSIDSLMMDVTTIGSIMARFNKLFPQRSTRPGLGSTQTLMDLYGTAEKVLSLNESRLALWNMDIFEVSLSSWVSLHQDMANDPISGYFWNEDVQTYFSTVYTFHTMLDYHSITLYWTIIMSLRLLLSDMLTLMVKTNIDGIPMDSRDKIENHRFQLMKYAINVLRTICYATHMESRSTAPFVLVTAFQLTVAVLERECNSLQAAPGNDEESIRRCEGLKVLAVRYLDWARQKKISVKIELDSPRNWEFDRTASVSGNHSSL